MVIAGGALHLGVRCCLLGGLCSPVWVGLLWVCCDGLATFSCWRRRLVAAPHRLLLLCAAVVVVGVAYVVAVGVAVLWYTETVN